MTGMTTTEVLDEVETEREQQDAKWGEQNHPDGTGAPYQQVLADLSREDCQRAADAGTVTWAYILLEEVYEALAEKDPERLAAELIQVAAVAVNWREAIARRLAPPPAPLTADDFSTGAGPGVTTLPMTEGEDGEHYGYGHIDPAEFAAAANAIDLHLTGSENDQVWTAEDVQHGWAVTTVSPDDGDGWHFEYVPEGTPNAFPVTDLRP